MCGKAEKQELVLIGKKLSKTTSTIAPDALVSLVACTHMERLKRNEHLIRACDDQFLDLLLLAAQNKKPVDVANVLTRYAFEVMVAMTTEKRAGFLDASPSTERVVRQLASWKFHSVLFGSFLRYHPLINSILNKLHFHSQGQSLLDPVMDVLGQDPNENGNLAFPVRDKEARIALVLAAADPTMTLILEVLRTVSQDQELQSQLSEEVRTSSLTKSPSFQSIIIHKAKTPLLHAVIQRQIRTQKLSDTGISFVAGAGGTRIGNIVVPEKETITITSVDSGLEPVNIRSPQALDPGLAPEINRQLPAYNLWSSDHSLNDCQQLLAAKLLIQVLQHFKIASLSNGHMSFTVAADESGREPASAGSPSDSDTLITLSDMEILHENLGPQLTDTIFEVFNPAEGSIMPRNHTFMVGPISHSGARHNLHQALENLYGKRILHKTDVDNVMYIAAKGVYLRNFTSKNYRGSRNNRSGSSRRNGHVHPWYKDAINGTRSSSSALLDPAASLPQPSDGPQTQPVAPVNATASSSRPQDARPGPLHRNSGEGAIDEEKHGSSPNILESSTQQCEQQISSSDAATAPAPALRFKERFLQKASNRLAGPRKTLSIETTVHDATGSTTIDGPGAAFSQHTVKTGLPPSNGTVTGFLPPHKRAALERQRQRQADEAAASASAQRVSTTLDPVAPIFSTVVDKTQPEAFQVGSMQNATTFTETGSIDATAAADPFNFFANSPVKEASPAPATSPHDVINLFTGEPATADDVADRWTTDPVLSGDLSSSVQEPPTAQAPSTSPQQPSLVRSHGSMDMSSAPDPSSPVSPASLHGSLSPLAPDFVPGSASS